MEILGGMAKGISLKVPGGALVSRPPSGRAERCSTAWEISEAEVYAIFSPGSGAVGFEFASRGAESVLFVEKSPQSLSALKSNLRKIEPLCSSCRFTVFSGTLPECAVRFSSLPAPDFIFADPPYAESSELLDGLLHEKSFTAWGGTFPDDLGTSGSEFPVEGLPAGMESSNHQTIRRDPFSLYREDVIFPWKRAVFAGKMKKNAGKSACTANF